MLTEVNETGTRIEKLRALAERLAGELDAAEDVRSIAPIAKQYRDTIREIDEIENTDDNDDEIEEIMQNRRNNGNAGAVRADRTKVQQNRRK